MNDAKYKTKDTKRNNKDNKKNSDGKRVCVYYKQEPKIGRLNSRR